MTRADRPRGHALRSASGSQLLILGVLLAVFALWVVPGLSSGSHGHGTAGEPDTGEIGEAVSSPAPDPTGDAYRAVRPGDCLAAPGTDPPAVVDCATDTAFMRVADVATELTGCPSGPGLSTWHHTGAGLTTALCLQREFRAGQCFAARLTTERGRPEMADADLRSRLECGTAEVPAPYNVVLVITEVLPAAARQHCAQDPAHPDGYWFWTANRGTAKVCATFGAAFSGMGAGAVPAG